MNYTEITQASIAYADRYDLEVSQNIDMFIQMVEARINRLLKTREQSSRAYALTADGQEYYSLPPDYAGMRDVQINSALPDVDHSVSSISYISPEIFNQIQNRAGPACIYYTVIANQIQLYPKQSAGKSIEMVYYQKLQNLNSIDNENWLSISYPDIYLAGITGEIELFAKNYEVAGSWFDRMKISVEELDTADVIERWSGSTLTTRVG